MNRILFYPYEIEQISSINSSEHAQAKHNSLDLNRDKINFSISLKDTRAKHIVEILNAKPLDKLKAGIVGQSKGTLKILEQYPESLKLEYNPVQHLSDTPPNKSTIHLVLGHLRPPVMARVIRDLSSMFVASIYVHLTPLVEKSYMQSKLWREIDTHVLEGLMQGDHIHKPKIEKFYSTKKALEHLEQSIEKQSLETSLDSSAQSVLRVVLHDEFENGLHTILKNWERSEHTNLVIAIGPERGYTEEDLNIFRQFGYDGAHLGSSILRSEVAIHIALGLFQCIHK